MTDQQQDVRDGLLATILSEEAYRPNEPDNLKDAGLSTALVESLVCKHLAMVGISSGRKIAEYVCLPFRLLEPVYHEMRSRQIIIHKNSAPLNDYNYALTEQGSERARIAMDNCAYVGAAPVPLMEYILSAEAQSIRAESPKREDLHDAFEDITIDEELFESLGPAINSGAGLFLYGEPGNGKSTLAKRITQCFGEDVWIPKVLIEDGQLIKLFDAAVHEPSSEEESSILKSAAYDRRWIKIRRPTVIVGGELTMDGLEIRYDPNSNVSEAPLQMKSNCGCFLIDDFGRQRIEPVELLNRWIVPLENRYDFLTLSTGKKIQVPFEQLIIFSTNLDPATLTDEAFLRRIPYKIEIGNPTHDEFHELFELYGDIFNCEYRPDVIDVLIDKHYTQAGRPMRRCHPRDLLQQIRNFCSYNELAMEMRDEYFDRVVKSYFSVVVNKPDDEPVPQATAGSASVISPPPALPADQPQLEVATAREPIPATPVAQEAAIPVAATAQQSPTSPPVVARSMPEQPTPEQPTPEHPEAPQVPVVMSAETQSRTIASHLNGNPSSTAPESTTDKPITTGGAPSLVLPPRETNHATLNAGDATSNSLAPTSPEAPVTSTAAPADDAAPTTAPSSHADAHPNFETQASFSFSVEPQPSAAVSEPAVEPAPLQAAPGTVQPAQQSAPPLTIPPTPPVSPTP